MALGSQIVNLVRLEFIKKLYQLHRISQVPVMQRQIRVIVDMVNAIGIETGGTADDAVDLVAFFKQEFSEVGAVLPCYTGNKCFFHVIRL